MGNERWESQSVVRISRLPRTGSSFEHKEEPKFEKKSRLPILFDKNGKYIPRRERNAKSFVGSKRIRRL